LPEAVGPMMHIASGFLLKVIDRVGTDDPIRSG
jgi:hypothetical protein